MAEVSTRTSTPRRVLCDRLYKPASRKGIIWFPGLNGTADHFAADGADQLAICRALTDAGFAVASRDAGALWGNSTSRTNTTNLLTHGQTTTGLFGSGKVHLLGISMGSLDALNWAKNNPTLVQSLLCFLPAVDPQDIYDNDRGGFQASIDAAYGGAVPDADCPADNAATFASAGFPIKLYYATDDPYLIASAVTTFASAVGSTVTLVNMGAVGHTIPDDDPPRTDVSAFFSAND